MGAQLKRSRYKPTYKNTANTKLFICNFQLRLSRKQDKKMALRIIYPAYHQPMDFSPESLFCAMNSCGPMMRKRRRVMPLTNWDRMFSEMLLPSYEIYRHRKSASDKDSTDDGITSDNFTKKMKLKNFKPEDIQVRVTADKKVVVEAKQEVKEENEGFHSYQLREFKQSLDVPENVNLEELTSSFNGKGELTISAPLLALPEPKKDETESKVPITFEKDHKKNEVSCECPPTKCNDAEESCDSEQVEKKNKDVPSTSK